MNINSPNERGLSTFWTTRIYGFEFVPPSTVELDIDICFVLWDDKAQKPRWTYAATPRFRWRIPGWWFGDVDPRAISPAAAEDALLNALETVPFLPTPSTGVLHMLTAEELAKIPPDQRDRFVTSSKEDFFRVINRTPREYQTPREAPRGIVDDAPFVQVDNVGKDALHDAPPSA